MTDTSGGMGGGGGFESFISFGTVAQEESTWDDEGIVTELSDIFFMET